MPEPHLFACSLAHSLTLSLPPWHAFLQACLPALASTEGRSLSSPDCVLAALAVVNATAELILFVHINALMYLGRNGYMFINRCARRVELAREKLIRRAIPIYLIFTRPGFRAKSEHSDELVSCFAVNTETYQ